ncbi:MAG: hypothetical protein LBG48_01480 [Rickettsiales bacterium]|jgi:hypothetical protein|nr:hypothetical protein [Rickettsiales bacterium]
MDYIDIKYEKEYLVVGVENSKVLYVPLRKIGFLAGVLRNSNGVLHENSIRKLGIQITDKNRNFCSTFEYVFSGDEIEYMEECISGILEKERPEDFALMNIGEISSPEQPYSSKRSMDIVVKNLKERASGNVKIHPLEIDLSEMHPFEFPEDIVLKKDAFEQPFFAIVDYALKLSNLGENKEKINFFLVRDNVKYHTFLMCILPSARCATVFDSRGQPFIGKFRRNYGDKDDKEAESMGINGTAYTSMFHRFLADGNNIERVYFNINPHQADTTNCLPCSVLTCENFIDYIRENKLNIEEFLEKCIYPHFIVPIEDKIFHEGDLECAWYAAKYEEGKYSTVPIQADNKKTLRFMPVPNRREIFPRAFTTQTQSSRILTKVKEIAPEDDVYKTEVQEYISTKFNAPRYIFKLDERSGRGEFMEIKTNPTVSNKRKELDELILLKSSLEEVEEKDEKCQKGI